VDKARAYQTMVNSVMVVGTIHNIAQRKHFGEATSARPRHANNGCGVR
jgi:hypothetical protein